MTDIRFDGRVAVVTGAGGGLGEAYALELARRGCKVVVNDLGGGRDGQGAGHGMADQVVEKIRAVCGEAVASYAGVHSAEGGLSIVDTAMSRWGRLDILINNAGILRDRSFANMNEDEWRAVIDVHLHGAYYVTHSAFRVMKERGYGRILFTTSVSGMFGNFGQANYAAAKMGQLGLMNVLAIEGAKYGIKTNAISPAAATRMTEDLNRSGQPRVSRDIHHVTPAAVYLVSEACQANGAIIHASNGFFGATQMAYNPGVFLGPSPVSVEAFAARWAEISRMDEAIQVQKETPYLRYVLEKAAAGGGGVMIAHKATLHSPFCELVGLQFLEESPGACRCKLAVRDELCNPFKRMHGGALFTLADTAMGVALYHTLDEGQRCATQEIQIRYLQGAREGEVICNARLTGVSNGIAHLEAEIESRSGLIAKAAGTFFVYTPGGVRPAPAGGEDTWPRVPQRIRAEV